MGQLTIVLRFAGARTQRVVERLALGDRFRHRLLLGLLALAVRAGGLEDPRLDLDPVRTELPGDPVPVLAVLPLGGRAALSLALHRFVFYRIRRVSRADARGPPSASGEVGA